MIDDLKNLPPARKKTIISVYKYKNQRGQYIPDSPGVSYPTAIIQGATSMLVKALCRS
jgi:curli production assembly/transport component CsgG